MPFYNHPRGYFLEKGNEMDTGIVRQLLDGSAEIDRMRKEIDLTISILMGFIHPERMTRKLKNNVSHIFLGIANPKDYHGKAHWIISGESQSDGVSSKPMVECMVGDNHSHPDYQWPHSEKFQMALRHVQVVYESLPVFVEGMAREFPQLSDDCQPLINAAVAKK